MSEKKKATEKDAVESSAEPPPEAETVEVPAAAPVAVTTPAPPRYSRGAVAAGVAGLLAIGGVSGFAIGRETGDDNGPRIAQVGERFPGQGPGQGGPQMRRNDGDQRGQLPQFPDQGGAPVRPDSGGDSSGT